MRDATDCGFCGSSDSEKIGTTSRAKLLDQYRKMHDLVFPPDVLETNFDFRMITTKRCKRCETIFYDPMIAGNAAYYEYLSRNVSWYYSAKRWEYPIAAELLLKERPGLFLEVGCGAGHFLRMARGQGFEGHGFDLNPRHREALRAEGFTILTELDRSVSHYNALFMFQVLEHLIDPYGFLASVIPSIQPGGVLILSTPVTPSCVGMAEPPFALPPHHQWMPATIAFRFLAERLGLICETVTCDPPDDSQIVYWLKKRCGLSSDLKQAPLYLRLASRLVLKGAATMRCEWAKVGHTGMAVLRKPRTS